MQCRSLSAWLPQPDLLTRWRRFSLFIDMPFQREAMRCAMPEFAAR